LEYSQISYFHAFNISYNFLYMNIRILNIKKSVIALKKGKVIITPTESVFGLSCDPKNINAVFKIIKIKKRLINKGMIIVAGEVNQFDNYINWNGLTKSQIQKIYQSWPGPYTWLVPPKAYISKFIIGDNKNLAVRVTSHPILAKLSLSFKGPIISTSANFSGHPPSKEYLALQPEILNQVFGILKGKLGSSLKPSQIKDAKTGIILR